MQSEQPSVRNFSDLDLSALEPGESIEIHDPKGAVYRLEAASDGFLLFSSRHLMGRIKGLGGTLTLGDELSLMPFIARTITVSVIRGLLRDTVGNSILDNPSERDDGQLGWKI